MEEQEGGGEGKERWRKRGRGDREEEKGDEPEANKLLKRKKKM